MHKQTSPEIVCLRHAQRIGGREAAFVAPFADRPPRLLAGLYGPWRRKSTAALRGLASASVGFRNAHVADQGWGQGCLVLSNSGHFEDEADVQRGAPTGVLDVFAS